MWPERFRRGSLKQVAVDYWRLCTRVEGIALLAIQPEADQLRLLLKLPISTGLLNNGVIF